MPSTMSWPFDTSAPLVTPAENSEYMRLQAGMSDFEWAMPPTLVATFQRAAWERLTGRCGIASETGLGPGHAPLCGQVDGVRVAAARLMVGAPATALTMEIAIARGVRNVVVVGAAGSLRDDLPVGSAVVISTAEREDGTSHHYLPAGEVVEADQRLSDLLVAHATERGARPIRGRSWTIDAPYRETAAAIRRHRHAGVSVVEMEAAAMFAVARVRGIRAGLIVSISDEVGHAEWRPGFDHERYRSTLLA